MWPSFPPKLTQFNEQFPTLDNQIGTSFRLDNLASYFAWELSSFLSQMSSPLGPGPPHVMKPKERQEGHQKTILSAPVIGHSVMKLRSFVLAVALAACYFQTQYSDLTWIGIWVALILWHQV